MTQWLRPPGQQGPGIGQQLAQSAAKNVAATQAAKLGLGAAGTAIGGPLGGAVGTAAGELAGPLASQLVGSLFMKGGPVHLQGGGVADAVAQLNDRSGWGQDKASRWDEYQKILAQLQAGLQQPTAEAPAGEVTPTVESAPTIVPDRAVGGKSGGSGKWDIPLGKLLGADWSTQGDYAAGTKFDDGTKSGDNWNAGIKGTWTFNKGGEVEGKKASIWDSVKNAASKAWKNDNLAEAKGRWKNVQYKNIGGMTTGPLGMSDMMLAGKDKNISSVKIKKAKGDMSEEVQYDYHAPLAPKPKTGE